MRQVLIHEIQLKKTELANLKINIDRSDFNKFKNLAKDLSNFEK